jgi:hypothetical protein
VGRVIGPRDFKQASRFVERHERQDAWWVCEEYEIAGGEIVARFPSLHAHLGVGKGVDEALEAVARWEEQLEHWRLYQPLEETPDLFLKFAYLYEQDNFPKSALDFSTRFGVPGSSSSQWNTNRERTSLYSFREESRRAWLILKLYEAVLSRDGKAARALLYEHSEEVLGTSALAFEEMPLEFWLYPNDPDLEMCVNALDGVTDAIEKSVQALCRPTIIRESSGEHLDVSRLRSGWNFCNLLGAAYLQAFWLVTSSSDLSRCEYCRRLMFDLEVHPNGRKRRKDTKFCNAAHRQAHYMKKKKR